MNNDFEKFYPKFTNKSDYDKILKNPEFEGIHPSRKRELILADGLRTLAKNNNIQLKEPLQIDSLGEFSIVVEPEKGAYTNSCGKFGDTFAKTISQYEPRTGVIPTKHLDGLNGWCRINHFSVEKMLRDQDIL